MTLPSDLLKQVGLAQDDDDQVKINDGKIILGKRSK